MHPLEAQASEFAHWAHGSINQTRNYSGEPYIVHPAQVVSVVKRVRHTPEMLAAAWLHDVVEDVESVTSQQIHRLFGPIVGEYVDWLTTERAQPGVARAIRKANDRARAKRAPAEVQTIRVADMLCNVPSIVKHDRKFAQTYVPEKAAMLLVLTRADPLLLGESFSLLVTSAADLNVEIFR